MMGPLEKELRELQPGNIGGLSKGSWRSLSQECTELLFECSYEVPPYGVLGDESSMPDILSYAIELAEACGL